MAAANPIAEYYAEVGRKQRYNFGLHMIEGGIGIFGMSSFHCESVLTAYVQLLTDSRFLAVLPGTLVFFSWGFPMLFMGFLVGRFRTRKWLTVFACSLNRLCYTGMLGSILALPYVGVRWSLVIFFGSLAANSFAGGFASMAWQDLLGRLVLPGYRGRFFGMRNMVCVIASVAAVGFVAWMLPAEDVRPAHYALPLGIGLIFYWASIALIGMSRETEYPVEPYRDTLGQFWRKMYRRLVADKALRRYTLGRVLMQAGSLVGMSLFTHYALHDFGLPEKKVLGAFAGLFFAVQVVGSPLAGWFGDRFGFRRLVALSALLYSSALAVGLTLHLWGGWVLPGFCVVSMLIGCAWAAGAVGHMNMAYEFGSVEERPVVMAIAYGLPSVVLLVAKGGGGLLADAIGGVRPVMALALAFAVAGSLFFAFGMPEPPGERSGAGDAA